MLSIDIPPATYEKPGSWDGTRKVLIRVPAIHLELEHSLISISKWESKWKIPFLESAQMTSEQFLDYCRCMTTNRLRDLKDYDVYSYIRNQDAQKIFNYMHDPMTARKLKNVQSRRGPAPAQMTSEYFYFLMIQYGIPFDVCEKWHFGRLIALIDCCQSNNSEGKTMNHREKQQYYATLNAQRRALLGSKG